MRRELHSAGSHSILTLVARQRIISSETRPHSGVRESRREAISRPIKILRKEEECLECPEETRNYSRHARQLTLPGNFLDYTIREPGLIDYLYSKRIWDVNKIAETIAREISVRRNRD